MVNVFTKPTGSAFVVPDDFDYSKSTAENYRSTPGVFYGQFADIRRTRDYSPLLTATHFHSLFEGF
jgi:hypothetical protein